jgi:hypothetical protein
MTTMISTEEKPAGVNSGPGGKTATSVLSTPSIPQTPDAVDSQFTCDHSIAHNQMIAAFLGHLHRGGRWAYWWLLPGKQSIWWPAGEPPKVPDGNVNVYFGVHPAASRKGTYERSTLDNIAVINCLFAEFDAKDFDGDKPAALAHVNTLSPAPSVVIDSGGGYHCYWLLRTTFALDTDQDRERARSVQRDWVTFVGGDPGAKDLARVLRVPGTRNLKHDHRPVVSIVHADLSCLYDLDALEALLAARPVTPPQGNNGGNGKSAWAEAALADELATLARTHQGQRNEQLNRSAFALGQVVGGGLLDRSEVERSLTATALGIGLEEREVAATVRSGIEAGIQKPRGPKEREEASAPPDELQSLIDQVGKAAGQERHEALRALFGHLVELDGFTLADQRERVCRALGINTAQFNRFLKTAQSEMLANHRSESRGRYVVDGNRLCIVRYGRDGEKYTEPLCNFSAQVTEEISRDDGQDVTREFVITGKLETGKPLPTVRVDSTEFASMAWVNKHWGIRPVVRAGWRARDQLREAIQLRSVGAKSCCIYTHTGWRVIDGRRVFLHAGGALGLDEATVELDGELTRYRLPLHPQDVKDAMRTSLRFLDVAPLAATIPLLAGVYLAPLIEIVPLDSVLWLYGSTGTLKSTLAALALCHYGQFTVSSLPVSWSSSAFSLEMTCFHAKDVALVIDDFAPQSDPVKKRKMASIADYVIRNVGNRDGRGRLNPDLTQRGSHPPRGLVVSTGELLPDGQSIQARVYVINIQPGDVDIAALTAAQAEAGRYPHAMAGYLRWVADQWDFLAQYLPQKQLELRTSVLKEMAGSHLRIPDVLATLYLGLDLMLAYTTEVGALNEAEAQELRDRGWEALKADAEAQARRVEMEKPTVCFFEVLRDLLAQGKVRLEVREGIGQIGGEESGSELLGWYDDDCVYLLPGAAYNRVARFLRDEGLHFPVKSSALRKHLCEEGFLMRGSDDRYTDVIWLPQREKSERVLRLRWGSVEPFIDLSATPRGGTNDLG